MENKQRVFIRGVEGRGDEVRQALINLGGKNVHDFCYGDTEGLFFINHNGEIRYASEFSEMGKIIMDCYTELHLPEKWNDGDLLVAYSTGVGKLYAVYSDDSEFMNYSIITYVSVTIDTYGVNAMFSKDRFKLASDEEHKEFYDLLHKHGKDWDTEKRELVDWKWEPKENERYYYIDNDGEIVCDTWDGYQVDANRYNFGNCFRTREEAKVMAEKVKKLLKGE